MITLNLNLRKSALTFALLSGSLFTLQSFAATPGGSLPVKCGLSDTITCITGEPDTLLADGVSVDRSALCISIEGHEPAGTSETFHSEVGRVYFFTNIKTNTQSQIRHVWYYEGKEYSNVLLDVHGPSFRTWSYKTIPPKMTGKWSVEVQAANGKVLDSKIFNIQ